ncbi:MAG: Tol-Pal system beta propeller repeat protein TolB [Gammaproteobacteria bacterium]|nr:MAG: Tol-Pal system beta propeller repeat protein TolB [Gammaproteobacteria bacterium]
MALGLCMVLAAWSAPAAAVLQIEITQGVEGATPIAVLSFLRELKRPLEQFPSEVIRSDLHRSGRFAPEKGAAPLKLDADELTRLLRSWKARHVDYLVTGAIRELAPDRYRVEFRLFDTLHGEQLLGRSTVVRAADLRAVAHQISDAIYEKLLGVPGAFDTRVAYVVVKGQGKQRSYALQVADADGHNPRTVYRSSQPIMSPAWSPDNRRLAYVSFEGNHAAVWEQELATGKRRKLSSHPGINGAPAWSPDGRRLALTLSKDGNPEIYVLDLGTGGLQRITRNRAIDTEPAWSHDGSALYFTSDRSGAPQIYRKPLAGGPAVRLTWEGRYNASADPGPGDEMLALVHQVERDFRIAVLDRRTGLLQVLTDGRLDESPSFSPNGAMIIYATEERGRGVLAAVSSDGRVRQVLRLQEGEVREPAWSGYLKRPKNRIVR